MMQSFTSVVLSIGILGGAVGVVACPSLVYSAFLLGGVLLGVGGLYVELNADFVAAAQLLVYIGAINVLILFAIMLVSPGSRVQTSSNWNPGEAILSAVFVVACIKMIQQTPWVNPPFEPEVASLVVLGGHLFSDFLLPFEVVSIVLLVALVGAIVIARRDPAAS